MQSIQQIISKVGTALATVSSKCYHYRKPNNAAPAYIVWAEDREEGSFNANNVKQEQTIHGTVDYFTQAEYDTAVDSIQTALTDAGAGYRINSVQYEDDTKLIHYEWEFWVN